MNNYQTHSLKNAELAEEKRKQAWKTDECKAIYRNLIQAAGGFEIVRPGMRSRAKDLAITSYLRGDIPDEITFTHQVQEANENKRGPGKPPKMEDKALNRTVTMTDSDWNAIQTAAGQEGISASEYIRRNVPCLNQKGNPE